MLNCKEATRLMSEAQDRELAGTEKWSLRVHLVMCKGCRNFSRHMLVLRQSAQLFKKKR
ncbi:zf-HC2 domain-containing protein [Chitinibacteraceae bacterium HSL-7]